MRYPVVLLDVGETLIGPRVSFGETYARVFRGLGLDLPGRHFERCIREVWQEMQQRIPAGRDRYRLFPGGEEEYWLHFCNRTLQQATGESPPDDLAPRALAGLRDAFAEPGTWQVYPDVVPVLRRLEQDGVRLGIVSNWDSRLPGLLDLLDLSRYFEIVGVSHLEGMEKPDPALFLRVLERMDARPEQALHVGDVPELDLAGAAAAGIAARLVDRKGRLEQSFEALPDLSDLPRIVRG